MIRARPALTQHLGSHSGSRSGKQPDVKLGLARRGNQIPCRGVGEVTHKGRHGPAAGVALFGAQGKTIAAWHHAVAATVAAHGVQAGGHGGTLPPARPGVCSMGHRTRRAKVAQRTCPLQGVALTAACAPSSYAPRRAVRQTGPARVPTIRFAASSLSPRLYPKALPCASTRLPRPPGPPRRSATRLTPPPWSSLHWGTTSTCAAAREGVCLRCAAPPKRHTPGPAPGW